MCIEIGTEFHCLGGEDNNSNSYRNRARIPLFGSIISGNQCYKDKARIPVFGRIRSEFQFFLKIRPELQHLEGYDQSCNIKRIGPEFQCV